MDYYYTNRQSAAQGRKFGFPSGMFQRKSQFGEPNSYDMITRTNTSYAGYTVCTGLMCEPRQEPTIGAGGGAWLGPTRAGRALPPDVSPLGDGGLTGMGQSLARSKTMPVSGGSYNGKSGNVIDSREAVKKYGGQFIFR